MPLLSRIGPEPQGYILSDFYGQVRTLSSSRIFVDFSLKHVYITPWLGKIFKWMVFRLPENAFVSQKIESRQVTHAPSCNSPPPPPHPHVLLIITPMQREITHSPHAVFFFFLKIYSLQQKYGGRKLF